MKKSFLSIIFIFFFTGMYFTNFAQNINSLPKWNALNNKEFNSDWLITPVAQKAEIYRSENGKNIILCNGLVKRIFCIQPNVACIDYTNMSNGQQLLRAIKPEAKIIIDKNEYEAGGLHGQKENAYLLPDSLNNFTTNANDFEFEKFETSEIKPFLNWKPKGWVMNKNQPTGKMLSFIFQSSLPELKNILVKVNYELYDGIPLIIKWISVENKTGHTIILNRAVNEKTTWHLC
jgi:phage pi2 protein 07